MSRLDRFCDEAAFADWYQDSPDLPDWQTGWRRDFPAPVVTRRPRRPGACINAQDSAYTEEKGPYKIPILRASLFLYVIPR